MFCSRNFRRVTRVIFIVFSGIVLGGATCQRQVTEKDKKESTIHLELAHNYLKQGDIISARREALLSVEKDPYNSEAHYSLAYIFGQMEDWQNALKEIKKSIEIDDKKTEAQNFLGVVLINLERYDEAIEILDKLTKNFLYHSPHLAYGNLGLAYFKKKEYSKALEALKKSVSLQPLFCLGYFRMGKVYFEMGRLMEAIEALEKCISVEDEWQECKKFQDAYLLLGDVYSKINAQDKAQEGYQKCVELNPNNPVGVECKRKKDAISSSPGAEGENK